MILLQQRFLRDLLLFMLVVLINVYLGIYIDSEVLKKNCFPYETAFENFRDEEVSEEVINSFLYDFQHMEESDITEQKIKPAEDADFAKLSEYLAIPTVCLIVPPLILQMLNFTDARYLHCTVQWFCQMRRSLPGSCLRAFFSPMPYGLRNLQRCALLQQHIPRNPVMS